MELIHEYRALIASIVSIAALLFFILRFRLNAFVGLMIATVCAALAAGLSPDAAYAAVTKGFGGTLGFIGPVIGLGAVFGAILHAMGGVEALARGLGRIGNASAQSWAMGFAGLVAATPVFFDVALIILLPFVFGLAGKSGKAPLYFGLPLCAGLAVGHAFIPPTPGPIAIAELIGADLGWVIIFGSVIGLISAALAGPVYTHMLDRMRLLPIGTAEITSPEPSMDDARVSFATGLGLMLLPLVLILSGTVGKSVLPDGMSKDFVAIIGHPFAALVIASGATWITLRPRNSNDRQRLNHAITKSFEPTGLIILVTGAGGAFKQVLVDTEAGSQLATMMLQTGMTPLFVAYALALTLRLMQGSATVAMITAAGLSAPLLAAAGLSAPELALAAITIAAGATGFSHFNDSGFWLVNRLFGLSTGETLRAWTLSTGIISVIALILALIIAAFV